MTRILLIVSFLVVAVFSSAQTSTSLYSKQWKEIDSLVFKKNLSRTALVKVNLLYKLAKEKDQQVQMIKALLYRLNLEEKFTERDINAEIKQLLAEGQNAKSVLTKSILFSLVADKYNNYFERNRWKLYERSKTVNFKKEDIATWSADDFHAAITSWHQQSLLASTALQQADVDQYKPILTYYNTKVYRPSLYDLLAHRALDYFKSDETYISKPTYAFEINDPAALGSINTFTGHSFTTKDSVSNKWKALLLFQQLIRFHDERKDTTALIDVNLDRIAFARNNGTIANEDSLYYVAVKENAERFSRNRYSAQAWFLLAEWHSAKANEYKPPTDTSNRRENLKALEICKRFIPLTDSTEGHYNLFNLYHSITSSTLHLSVEQVNVTGAPFRSLVNYKNVNKLHYRVIRSTKKIEDAIEKSRTTLGWDNHISIASSFEFLNQQVIDLPATNDYQQHSVEIKIDALPTGKYILLGSSSAGFADTSRLALATFYVSDISYVNNGQHYFVLNRTTGKPLAKASVQVWQREYNSTAREYQKTKKESYITDANGYFQLTVRKNNNRNIGLQIRHKQDELFMETDQYVYPLSYSANNKDDDYEDDEEYEEDHSKAFFFKDRSIYRLGQVVYFKMLALTKDRETKKVKLYTGSRKKREYVYLQDVNNKKLDSLLINLNEYGSFAGNFKLPLNGLTGEFSLTTSYFDDEKDGEFSVEEYKRPTFYVQLEKPKGTYRLNDTLTVTGTAKAYAGNTVDGATIKYSVTRKGRFLYPWLWHRGIRPTASETTINFGEATTDAAGKFTVRFAAIPDEATAKEMLPIFDYEVNADVTDRAGETRSSSVTVSAGYHSLNLKLTVKETTEADSLKSLLVSAENIAGDKEPATVKVSIYPLQSPTQLIRKRYWQQPDQFIYTKEEYKQLFPHDEYSNESDKATWPKSPAVFTTTINTKETGKVEIPKGTLTSGWYLVEATTTDKDGREIKDTKYVQLYSRKDGQFKGTDYLFSSVNNNVTTPGGEASFLVGSSAEDVHVIQETQRKPKAKSTDIQSDFKFHQLNKAVKEITVTPSVEDIGGMGVNFVFVKDNRDYFSSQRVEVAEENNDLNVEVLTYRDKIEPGNKEKWTVKITGKNKEAVAAEVLTSMYDASLDQFKSHSWGIPRDQQPIFYSNGWDNNSGFMQVGSTGNNVQVPHKWAEKMYADIDVNLSKTYVSFMRGKMVDKGEEYSIGLYSPVAPQQERMLAGRVAGVQANQNMDETVVVGYGAERKNGAAGSAADMQIRGISSLDGNTPLYVVDGVVVTSIDDINKDDIANMEILQGAAATAAYGARGANGVVVITTKNGAGKQDEPILKLRTNFNETAFFFPQLVTDKDGSLSFTFTLPDALTQWRWQILAHNMQANFGLTQKTIVSQKTLMVQANAPRFMREGDKMEFSAKVSNLSDKELNGKATLQLVDAVTGEPADNLFTNNAPVQNFTIPAGQSTAVLFDISVPANFNKPVTWRIVAKAGQFADGEENSLPVLTNRMLVTESLPLFVKGDTAKKFTFTKLLNQQSNTLQHQSVTLEYTTNPVWYAVQALPYLIEFPYECSEQTFNRFFANALASRIINSNPKIKQVFELWKKDSSALKSNLQKNEELKSILLQETPWVLQAENEEQQKKNLALLFDAFNMQQSFKKSIEQLKQMQLSSGGFPWFKGGDEDRYITQYIVTGIGRLQKMAAIPTEQKGTLMDIAGKALVYLDEKITDDFKNLSKYKADPKKNNTGAIQIQYLYAKSFFNKAGEPKKNTGAYNYYYQQAKQYWTDQSHYFKAMIGAVLLRSNEGSFAVKNILPALMENAVTSEEAGMYWKQNEHSYYWYHAPVEQQALMIEFVNEIHSSKISLLPLGLGLRLDEMKTWLLRQKQTTNWRTTKATADACYALLLNGSNWVMDDKKVSVQLGGFTISSNDQPREAGSGYFKTKIEASKVTPALGNISVTTSSSKGKQSAAPSWGAVYWQYFEDLDKITSAATPLLINKKLFVEQNTDRGVVLQPVNDGDELKVGNKVKIRIEIKVDRNMEYVHLKDMRAASMEPVNVLSSYKWQDGLGYYESTRDAATNFFISYLPKGTYVFEYPVTITHTGNYSVGIASAQCMYAPEFNSHSEGIRIEVK